jgi:protein-L-isoaspartate(D-aspartate) O-methyltransferase
MSNNALVALRRAYAKALADAVGGDERLEHAFAAVRRETFLGSGPWLAYDLASRGYVATASDDPKLLYTNQLFAIAPERQINNGEPALHAYLLRHAAPRAGEHVVHVGAGVGYYSAIMAELVGSSGAVTAIEYEADIAERARANLRIYPHARVIAGDGSSAAFDAADVIYVNAGATRPADIWLDRLKDGGRLVLPLTTRDGFSADAAAMRRRGGVFLIERAGTTYNAHWISPVAIYPCAGMRDDASERALADAFANDGFMRVTRLYRDDDTPAERCWMKAPGWSLAYA